MDFGNQIKMKTKINKELEKKLKRKKNQSNEPVFKIMEITNILITKIEPNDYNPNEMTDEEFKECKKEIKHLGRIPKPIVVKPNKDKYTIIDGEHSWRASKELGFKELPCEVLEVDLIESMRQSYKRNQHGTFNKIKLGKMFQRALDTSGQLSRRGLAKKFELSEGTIRNYLLYWKAWQLRNDYATKRWEEQQEENKKPGFRIRDYNNLENKLKWEREEIEKLSTESVRAYVKLPSEIRDVWLIESDGDTNFRYLFDSEESAYTWLEEMVEDGFGKVFVHNFKGNNFQLILNGTLTLGRWENDYCKAFDKPRKEVRKYTKWFIDFAYIRGSKKGNTTWVSQISPIGIYQGGINQEKVGEILKVIWDKDKKEFLITPEELEEIIKEGEDDVIDRIHLLLVKKGYAKASDKIREKPDPRVELAKKIIEEAPDYFKKELKNSKIHPLAKKYIVELKPEDFGKDIEFQSIGISFPDLNKLPEWLKEENKECHQWLAFKKTLIFAFENAGFEKDYKQTDYQYSEPVNKTIQDFEILKRKTESEKPEALLKKITENFKIEKKDLFKQFSDEQLKILADSSELYVSFKEREKEALERMEKMKGMIPFIKGL